MKTILLSGDSRGVGIEIVKRLLDIPGYRIIGISRTLSEESNSLIQEFGDRYIHIDCDLAVPGNIPSVYKKQLKAFGPFGGLINNAAYAYDDIVTNANLEQIEIMFKVNVYSPIMLTKYILRDMLLNNTHGSIVHITSVCAHTGYKGLSMYSATKGALESFSRTVAREWGSKKIRSNCVAPGFMETLMSDGLSSDNRNKIYQRTSLKEQTDITSVAKTACFLLSNDSNSITGQTIHVDNGTI